MKKEPPDELMTGKGHGFVFVTIGVVLPGEGDRSATGIGDSAVCNGNAVRVPAEILENSFGPGKGWLEVHDPLFLIQ